MPVSLGKRKRRAEVEEDARLANSGSEDDDEDTTRALFQRAFEAKFKPLAKPAQPAMDPQPELLNKDDETDKDDEWAGISGGDEAVELIQLRAAADFDRQRQKREAKAFMSAKPPPSHTRAPATVTLKPQPDQDDEGEKANLKHDLALHRLLQESHLLHPSTFSATQSAPEGKGRIKALDLRLQGLGAKSSSSEQEKMPMAHRKGIVAKSAQQEQRRRKEAAENGVILERARAAAKAQVRRERSVGGPGIGSFKRGTLKLSSSDVRSIEGPKQTAFADKGRRKR